MPMLVSPSQRLTHLLTSRLLSFSRTSSFTNQPATKLSIMVKVIANGQVIAESDAPVIVEGNQYFPPESVKLDLFSSSDTQCASTSRYAILHSISDRGTMVGTPAHGKASQSTTTPASTARRSTTSAGRTRRRRTLPRTSAATSRSTRYASLLPSSPDYLTLPPSQNKVQFE